MGAVSSPRTPAAPTRQPPGGGSGVSGSGGSVTTPPMPHRHAQQQGRAGAILRDALDPLAVNVRVWVCMLGAR